MAFKPRRFIGEPVEVRFEKPPVLEKKPGCPDGFVWNETSFSIVEKVSEWHDYRRHGRMAVNMRPEHALRASTRGSWGVGRDFFRVRVDTDQIFDIYFDRAPNDVDRRKGGWYLLREMESA
jgi:hypothetical protein